MKIDAPALTALITALCAGIAGVIGAIAAFRKAGKAQAHSANHTHAVVPGQPGVMKITSPPSQKGNDNAPVRNIGDAGKNPTPGT